MLEPGAVIHASTVVVVGTLQVGKSGAILASDSFSIQRSAVLTVVVDSNPGNRSVISVLIAQFATFGGGTFANTSTQAMFSGSECVQLGAPVISATSSSLSATIVVTPLITPNCTSGSESTALAGIIVGSVVGLLIIISIVGVLIFRQSHVKLLKTISKVGLTAEQLSDSGQRVELSDRVD